MKTKRTKLTFTKATVVDLGDVRGGIAELEEDRKTKVRTGCDLFTDCYNISRCMTVCGGPYC